MSAQKPTTMLGCRELRDQINDLVLDEFELEATQEMCQAIA